MADKYSVVQNFRYGLDGRKSVLTSQPGTLIRCQDGFINSGGEVEGRMGFVKDAVALAATTFGLQDTDEGLVTFGSAAAPANLPTGVTYHQLAHPTGFDANGAASMTDVVFSCNFKGKAFVLAKWSDNKVFAYYNKVLVGPSRNGLVLYGAAGTAETISQLSVDLGAMVSALPNWIGDTNVSPIQGALAGSTLVKSPLGVTFVPVADKTSAGTGGIGQTRLGGQAIGAGAVAPYAAVEFSKPGVTGAGTITVVCGAVAITNGAVNYHTDLNTTVADVAKAVNNYTYITGFTAVAVGANLTFYAPASYGASSGKHITVTCTGDFADGVGAQQTDLKVILTPTLLSVTQVHTGPSIVGGNVVASVGGGSGGAVTYAWTEVEVGSGNGIVIQNPTAATCFFYKYMLVGSSVTGYFRCTATDGVLPTAYCDIMITLENASNA